MLIGAFVKRKVFFPGSFKRRGSVSAINKIKTSDDFTQFVAKVESYSWYRPPAAYGLGIARVSRSLDAPKFLDTRFFTTNFGGNLGGAAVVADTRSSCDTGAWVPSEAEIKQMKSGLAPF